MAEPLRAIVARLTTYACPWTAEEVASLSEVSLSGVRRFLTHLVNLEVLALAPSGQYSAGPQAKPWRDLARKHKGPSTYGNSAKYRAQRAVWDGIRQRDWTAKKRGIGAVLTSSRDQEATPAATGEHLTPLQPGDANRVPPMSIDDAAKALGCSHNTVRNLIATGKIRAHRIGQRVIRISSAEVDRYLAETLQGKPK